MTRQFPNVQIARLVQALCVACVICVSAFTVHAEPVGVKVRAGIHDRFNRMVFDWPVPVKYAMQQKDGAVHIQFTRPASLNMASFNAAKPPLIRNLRYSNSGEGLAIDFNIPDKSRVQAFWSGDSVAFDVLLMTPKKPVFETQKAPPVPAAETKPVQPDTPKDDTPPSSQDDIANPSAPEPAPASPAAAAAPIDTTGPQLAQILPGLPDKPVEDTVKEVEQAQEAIEKQETSPASRTLADDIADTEKAKLAGTVIHIRPLKKVGAAVFVRAGRLWAVFDQPLPDVAPQVEGESADTFKDFKQVNVDKATAFIFNLPDDMPTEAIAIRRDGLSWDIRLQDSKPAVDTISDFTLAVDNDSTLSLLTGQSSLVVPIQDDVLGDKMWVIPVQSPLLKVAKAQQTAVITMLPTIVGGLLIPQQEGLNIIAKSNQILIQDLQNPLPVSAAQDREHVEAEKPQQEKLFLLDLPDFPANVKGFEAQRQYLEKQIAKQSDKADKAVHALNMARLYLRQGYGLEAEGALALAQGYLPNLGKTPSFQALKGMAYALSGKTDKALTTLDKTDLQDIKLADVWRAYAYGEDKNWEKAFIAFRTQQAHMRAYPPEVMTRLALMAAESAVETENIKDGSTFLEMIPRQANLNASEKDARDFLKASILAKSSNSVDVDDATELLDKLSNGIDRYYRVKAAMALLNLRLADKSIKNQEAIDTLERLRYAWRGDRQEIMILQQLGRYYMADKKPLEAMTMWRQALALAENDGDKKEIQDDLQKQFNALFVNGDSKGMAPLQALALYQRFKELMPANEDGARATLQLADQLLEVDLVDEADELLQEQLNKQTAPQQTVAMGTKLAAIRLTARNPAGAVKALDSSNQDGIAADIQARRLLLRARALADLQQTSQALALLDNPSIPEGLSLRADIFWRLNRWADAAHDLQDLLDSTKDKSVKNKVYVNLIMRLAIVKALQNDQMGLDQLNAQYGELMASSPKSKAFQLMTTSLDSEGTLSDLETLKSQVADAELFETFLKDF